MTSSKSLKPWLKTSLGGNSRSSDLTMVVSMSILISFNIVQMQHYIPYTPQQNGVVERKNRSLKKMETYMMEAKNFPPKFWVEAINYASHIQNRVPQKQLDSMSAFKAWSGNKPDVTHFTIFGSKAWARIPT